MGVSCTVCSQDNCLSRVSQQKRPNLTFSMSSSSLNGCTMKLPWKQPDCLCGSLRELPGNDQRWLNPSDYMFKKRERAHFTTNRIQKFAADYQRSRPQMEVDSATFISKLM